MKRYLTSFAVMFLTVAAFAQTTSAPALPTINCPDIESLIASIPANLWPKDGLKGQALIDQGAKFKAWSDKSAKGNKIAFPNVTMKARKQGIGTESGIMATSLENTRVIFVNIGNPSATSLTCDGASCINNHGIYTVTIVVK
jgi:hypothetical protein